MEICAYRTVDKGKGSCYGKRGERWYHIVDNLRLIIATLFTFQDFMVPLRATIGLIRYNVKHFKGS